MRGWAYLSRVRRFFLICALFALVAAPAWGATGRVIKVLPFLVDAKGRHALTPSLYDRDAYQAFLRLHPEKCSGMLIDIQWKTKGSVTGPLKLRFEMRGPPHGEAHKQKVLEATIEAKGFFSHWQGLVLNREDYKELGELLAWRATLWDGDTLLGEQRSFLW